MGMTGLPPGEFSLISPGTKIPGQVTLALFLSKNNVKIHSSASSKNAFMVPGFYEERMKEAKKLVYELKKKN
jgi:hypothetical protein